mmetsp:Transcript_20692/g.63316  ORF Transcript_20692/g.63316 Transcript_20692/m.63316 type:complete len:215 (-) Transcript_20692:1017-1661(-)
MHARAGSMKTENITPRDWSRLDQRVSTTNSTSSLTCPLPMLMTLVVAKAAVCSGACGMSPLPGGMPKRPHSSTSKPRTEKSQWYADGFFKLNLESWASFEETLWSKKKSAVSMMAGAMAVAMCHGISSRKSDSVFAQPSPMDVYWKGWTVALTPYLSRTSRVAEIAAAADVSTSSDPGSNGLIHDRLKDGISMPSSSKTLSGTSRRESPMAAST